VSTYEILELNLADTRRLYQYKLDNVFGTEFNLKGFDYPWIVSSRTWNKEERVIDVGAAYSPLPIHLATTYGCDIWAVDDFGLSVEDEFWSRHRDPEAYIREHPEVNYVLERLGDPASSSLPTNSFDCIYSASTLEHIPPDMAIRVWRHMDALLKPGGEMLHALDLALPTSRGLLHVLLAIAYDSFFGILPSGLRHRFSYETPLAYVRHVLPGLGVKPSKAGKDLSVLRMVLDPEVLLEPPTNTFNRIVKDGEEDRRHFRVTSLLIHLRKCRKERGE
jgi:2-polyprenyl-3-methyl-5-hydroxy-6-metoxy-1,4-benzoquinol methylase